MVQIVKYVLHFSSSKHSFQYKTKAVCSSYLQKYMYIIYVKCLILLPSSDKSFNIMIKFIIIMQHNNS
jgi:hypothetical protein